MAKKDAAIKGEQNSDEKINPYRLYRRGVNELNRARKRVALMLGKHSVGNPDDEFTIIQLQNHFLLIMKEIRQCMLADLDAKLKFHELRKLDIEDAETDEILKVFKDYAARQGYQKIDEMRAIAKKALSHLPDNIADALLDKIIPQMPDRVKPNMATNDLSYSIVSKNDNLMGEIHSATEELRQSIGNVLDKKNKDVKGLSDYIEEQTIDEGDKN